MLLFFPLVRSRYATYQERADAEGAGAATSSQEDCWFATRDLDEVMPPLQYIGFVLGPGGRARVWCKALD